MILAFVSEGEFYLAFLVVIDQSNDQTVEVVDSWLFAILEDHEV